MSNMPPAQPSQGLFNNFSTTACFEQGDCSMEDLVQLVVNIINLLLGLAGVIAMFFFAYGGYNWITSYGSDEKVQLGMKSIEGAVVGIVVVMAAWVGVRFVLVDWLGVKVGSGLRIEISSPPIANTSSTNTLFNRSAEILQKQKDADAIAREETRRNLAEGACYYTLSRQVNSYPIDPGNLNFDSGFETRKECRKLLRKSCPPSHEAEGWPTSTLDRFEEGKNVVNI